MPTFTTLSELRDARHVEGLFFVCGDCGKTLPVQTSGGTGYGYTGTGPDARPICYACCGEHDKQSMIDTGRAVLYLICEQSPKKGDTSRTLGTVSNWPGSLKFSCHTRAGRHNIAGVRYDCWFRGPDGYKWHGVTYGNNTQVCHCKRSKSIT